MTSTGWFFFKMSDLGTGISNSGQKLHFSSFGCYLGVVWGVIRSNLRSFVGNCGHFRVTSIIFCKTNLYSTALGNFDTNECVVEEGRGNGGVKGEPECCGSQFGGSRFPFNNRGGNRGCCGDRTYDTQMFSCCEDQTVLGSC